MLVFCHLLINRNSDSGLEEFLPQIMSFGASREHSYGEGMLCFCQFLFFWSFVNWTSIQKKCWNKKNKAACLPLFLSMDIVASFEWDSSSVKKYLWKHWKWKVAQKFLLQELRSYSEFNSWYLLFRMTKMERNWNLPLVFRFGRNRPNRLTLCCAQFSSPGVKILCVLHLRYNVAFTFKWYGNLVKQRVLLAKGLNWVQHRVSRFGAYVQKSPKLPGKKMESFAWQKLIGYSRLVVKGILLLLNQVRSCVS